MTLDARPKDRLEFLDAMRALAALTVVLQHGLDSSLPGFTDWSMRVFNPGQAGVCLFFLISGFIIPMSIEKGGSNARFWNRRFWRLFPLYWVGIALFALCCYFRIGASFDGSLGNFHVWLANATMLQEFFGQPHVMGVFWTLSVELVLYAICSVLFSIGLLNRTQLLLGGVMLAYGLAGTAGLFWNIPLAKGRVFLLLTALIGMATQRCLAGRLSPKTLLAAVAGLFVGLAVTVVSVERRGVFVPGFTLTAVLTSWLAAYLVFAWGITLRERSMPGFLCWCGQVSYSLYLLHPLLLLATPTHWPIWLYFSTIFGGSFALAAFTYRFIELPGIALGRRLEHRFARPTVTEAKQTHPEMATARVAA